MDPIIITCGIISVLITYFFWKKNRPFSISIWTTIGIGGTFISLLMNILQLEDISKIDVTFIKGFASAFWTSVIGIGGNIVVKALDTCFPLNKEEYEKKTERYYLNEILNRIVGNNNTIISVLEKNNAAVICALDTSIKYEIQEMGLAIREKLSLSIDKQENLQNTVLNIQKNITNISTTFTASAQKLVEELSATLTPLIEKMGATTLSNLVNTMHEAQNAIGHNLQHTLENLTHTSNNSIKDMVSKMQEFINASQSTMNNTAEALNAQMTGMQVLQSEQILAMQKAKQEQSEAISLMHISFQNDFATAQNTAQKTAAEFQADINDKLNQHLVMLENKLIHSHEIFEENINNLSNPLADRIQEFENSLASRMELMKDTLNTLHDWQINNKTAMDGTQKSFNDSVVQFSTLINQYDNNNRAIAEFSIQIYNLNNTISEIIAQNQNAFLSIKSQQESIRAISDTTVQLSNINNLLKQLQSYLNYK